MLSTALATTFAAVSSSGVLVIDGSSADSAGRKADAAIPGEAHEDQHDRDGGVGGDPQRRRARA